MQKPPYAVKGVLDLQQWDFDRNGPVSLSGEWKFYWSQFLTPADVEEGRLPPKTGLIMVPGYWNDYRVNCEPLPAHGYATYRLTVLLPPINAPFAFHLSTIETSHTLYVNEKHIGSSGTPGKTPETTTPGTTPYVTVFTPDTPRLEIMLHIANFAYIKGGVTEVLLLGQERQIRNMREHALAFEVFLFGSIFIMGLYHIGLFSLRKQDVSPLYFGVFCFLIGMRTLATGEKYFDLLFPMANWELPSKIAFLTIYLGLSVFAMFIHSLFPKEFSTRFLYVIRFPGIICSVLILVTPVNTYAETLLFMEIITIIAGGYALYVLIKALFHHREGALIFLIGFFVFFLTIVNDVLHDNQIIHTGFFLPFGVFIFIFSQAFLLSLRFSKAFYEVDNLSKALTKERILFRTLIDNMPDYIFAKDTRSHYLLANKKILSEAGVITMDEFAGKTDFDFLPKEFAQQYYAGEQHIFESGEPMLNREEPDQDLATGERKWLLTTKVPFRDEQGNIVGLVGISRDITPLKRMEEELKKHRENLERLVSARTAELTLINNHLRQEIAERQQIEDSLKRRNQELALLNRAGQMFSSTLELNEVLAAVLGEMRQLLDIVATSFWVLVPDTQELMCQQSIGPGSETVIGWRLPVGQGIVGKSAQIGEIINVADSRTDAQHYRGVDKQTGIELRSILSLPFRTKGNVIGVMSLMDTRVGRFTEEELRLVEPIAAAAASAIEHARLYMMAQQEIADRKRAEEQLQIANAELQATLEHLQQTQSQLIQSEKMAALGQLVAGVAHEINTPLGAINASIGNISHALDETIRQLPVLLRQLSSKQTTIFLTLIESALHGKQHLTSREERKLKRNLRHELEEYYLSNAANLADTLIDMGIYSNISPFLQLFTHERCDHILRTAYNLVVQHHNSHNISIAVGRASKIVFALKSYARYDTSGQMTMADIREGIECILILYQNQLKQGIEIVKHYEDIPAILCYPDELNQVWTNLIHNAIQAMQGKGRLEITVQESPLAGHPSFIPPSREDKGVSSSLVVRITDSGPGIPEDIQEHIFEPFFTTKPSGEGSGLGLDICRKIIDKHQGKIEVESLPGNTTFSVWLPIAS